MTPLWFGRLGRRHPMQPLRFFVEQLDRLVRDFEGQEPAPRQRLPEHFFEGNVSARGCGLTCPNAFKDSTELVEEHDNHEKAKHQRLHEVDDTQSCVDTGQGALPQVLGAGHKARDQHHARVYATYSSVKKEQHEELLVENSHAVVDPRAMVVHANYASFTCATMVRVVWFDHVAPPTQTGYFGLHFLRRLDRL